MMESPGTKNNEIFKAFTLLRLLNTLSIDIVIGAVFSSFLVVKILNVVPGWAYWLVLPISVWIVYTLDHIIDAIRLKKDANTYRHIFHFKYLKAIIAIIAAFSVVNLFFILFWLEKEIIYFGVVLSLITGLYLILVYCSGKINGFLPKEIFVSIIYTVGIWGGPIAMKSLSISSEQLMLMIIFFLLVLADVLLLSYYEIDSDKKDNHSSLAVKFGQPITKKIIFTFLLIVFAFSIFILFSDSRLLHRVIAKLFLIMGLIQIFILELPVIFNRHYLYRYFIEWTFWIPGLIIII